MVWFIILKLKEWYFIILPVTVRIFLKKTGQKAIYLTIMDVGNAKSKANALTRLYSQI